MSNITAVSLLLFFLYLTTSTDTEVRTKKDLEAYLQEGGYPNADTLLGRCRQEENSSYECWEKEMNVLFAGNRVST